MMKKFLLGTVGLIALGMAAPATAADLAARPYTKAPPPIVAPIYDWTGFYIGANGGWGQSHSCLNFDGFGLLTSLTAAARGPEVSSAARSATVGRPTNGCLAWKHRAIGRISATSASARFSIRFPRAYLHSHQDRWHRPLYRPDRLRLESSAVLRKGRCGGDEQPL